MNRKYNRDSNEIFRNLFILEMANNHWGSREREIGRAHV